MTADRYELAQVNIATLREPIDSPLLADFVAALDPINALADAAPGFVWRLQTEDGDATAIRPFDDERIMVNLSVWSSLDTLGAFVYRTVHTEVMRRRRTWFEKMPELFVALWWVPAGHRPGVDEARDRLEQLRRLGPTPATFTFRHAFPAPSDDGPGAPDPSDPSDLPTDDRWACPAG